jgi:hypothetical protein
MHIHPRLRAILFLIAVASLTGCLTRTHDVVSKRSDNHLQAASLEQLVEVVNRYAAQFQTLNAAVDIDSSVGGEKKGRITEYPEIAGYLFVRKPELLRLIGLVPVVRNTAFDMLSNGKGFQLSVPSKGIFAIGSDQVITPASEPLYNIRPQHILDALLLKDIDPQKEIVVLENGIEIVKDRKTQKDAEQEDYVLIVLSKDDRGYYLSRKIVFNRENLQPDRQLIYDRLGVLVTDARYDNPKDYNGLSFPSRIELERPVEEYSIALNISKLTLNGPIENNKFELPQPPGSKLINLDDKATAEALARPKIPTKKLKPKQE